MSGSVNRQECFNSCSGSWCLLISGPVWATLLNQLGLGRVGHFWKVQGVPLKVERDIFEKVELSILGILGNAPGTSIWEICCQHSLQTNMILWIRNGVQQTRLARQGSIQIDFAGQVVWSSGMCLSMRWKYRNMICIDRGRSREIW